MRLCVVETPEFSASFLCGNPADRGDNSGMSFSVVLQ